MVFDTQNDKPRYRIQLNRVGVRDLKTFVVIERDGIRQHLIPRVEIVIDLPADLKGVHMSRLVESMTEVLSEEFSVYPSVELLQVRILEALRKKHPFKHGEVTFRFEFGYASKTPVSKKRTWEVCDVVATTIVEEGKPIIHSVEVHVIGNTVCPHCLVNNDGVTHIQRAVGILRVTGPVDQIPSYGSMIEIVENSFSGKTYSLLKLDDEKYVTKQMHDNPQFVEDVCRNILQNAKEKYKDRVLEMFAEAISHESIHKHDVIAQGSACTNGEHLSR